MSTMPLDGLVGTQPAVRAPSVQPAISHNVRILMAYKGVNQKGIGEVVGKTATAVGHKLSGRADWSPDEIAKLSVFGGPQWPLARFFNDPEGREPQLPNPAPFLTSHEGGADLDGPKQQRNRSTDRPLMRSI